MKKVLTYSALALAALSLIVFKLKSNLRANAERAAIVSDGSSNAVPVLVSTARRTKFENAFTSNGNFQAIRQLELASEVGGRITRLYVKDGSVVKAGDLIAAVDDEVFRSDLKVEGARVEQTKQDLARFRKALETGGVTQKQVDDMKVEVEAAQSRYVQAERRIRDTHIKAPVDGIINERFVEVGTYLAPGERVVEIVDISHLKLAVNISESQVVQLRTGDAVRVTTNVYPEAQYSGKVTFIAPKGDATLNYPVEIEIVNLKGKELKAGMYGTAHFNLPEQTPLMLVPRSSFIGGVNSNQVFVLQDGRAHVREVIAGRIFGNLVEVRQGLNEGEVVITSGAINLVEGTAVAVQQ